MSRPHFSLMFQPELQTGSSLFLDIYLAIKLIRAQSSYFLSALAYSYTVQFLIGSDSVEDDEKEEKVNNSLRRYLAVMKFGEIVVVL